MNDGKLLLVTPDFPPNDGGVARYLRSFASYFRDQIEVVCAPNDRWQTFDPTAGYPIFRRELLSAWGFPRWWKTVSFLREFGSRYRVVVVSHVLPFGTAALFARKFTKIPYVVIVHGMDIRLCQQSFKKKWIAGKVLVNARVVVANSQALAQEVAAVFGIREVLVVYPCIENSVEKPTSHDPSSIRLLTVSRLVERKGHACVINALSLLKQSGNLGSITYDIVGDGPLKDTLQSMVSELGLESCVVFRGAVGDDEREGLYEASDLFVMPVSNDPVDKEGFGIVYLEAARHGVPSIATHVKGVNEAVIDGQTGILISGQDPQELAAAILRLVNDTETRERLGKGALVHATQFTCDKQMEKLRSFL